ncbi:MAG: hypothetical protein ACI4SG_00830 [Oligosphaeraceae bacterium]
MPKLCDKCHINPAVVHIRAMTPEGRRETSSYCLNCAVELFGNADIPADFREMLDELIQLEKSLKQRERKTPGTQQEKPQEKPQEQQQKKPACPHCGCIPGESYEKCGYCFASLRPFLLRLVLPAEGDGKIPMPPASLRQGGPRLALMSKRDQIRQLFHLLDIREASFLKGRLDGVESVQDEIDALRQEIMQAALEEDAHPASSPTTRALRPVTIHGGTLLPFPGVEEVSPSSPLVRLAISLCIFRTLVDPPGGFPEKPEECRRKMEDLFALSPVFQGGYRREGEPAIYSANGRVRAFFGRTEEGAGASQAADGRATFSLTILPWETYKLPLHGTSLMEEWEKRYHFFQDPVLGFFHPLRGICRAAHRLVHTLHLPALMALLGLERLRMIVNYLEGRHPCETMACNLFLGRPAFIPDNSPEAMDPFPCGLLVLKDCLMEWDGVEERVKRLTRVARILEKRELQARSWFLRSDVDRENLLDAISHSRALLRGARTLSPREMATALSRLWLGQELGCFPSLPRPRILKALGYFLDRQVQTPAPAKHKGDGQRQIPLDAPGRPGEDSPTWQRSLLPWEEQVARPAADAPGPDLMLLHQIDRETTERVRQILETPEEES